jgi:uronate dehydrogenase
MKFKKLFVTGALGALGVRILPALKREISLDLTDLREGSLDGEVPVSSLDLLDFDRLVESMKGCDSVLHLAIASVRDFIDNSDPTMPIRLTQDMTDAETDRFHRATLDVNVTGVYNLFEAARLAGVERVIYMSSITTVLGHQDTEILARPGIIPKPFDFYAVTKLFGEHLGELYHRKYGLNVISLRLGQPYPIGNCLDDSYLSTPGRRMANAHIEDVISMVRCALTTDVAYGVYYLTSKGEPIAFPLEDSTQIGYRPSRIFRESGVEVIS